MRRLLSQSVGFAFAIALFIAIFAASSAAEDKKTPKPCIAKKFEFKAVKKACKEGGQKAVKKLMKAVIKKAKKAGDENASGCLNCHENLKTYKNTPKAVEWLKAYVK